MTDFDIEMGLIELALIVALVLLVRWLWPHKAPPVIGQPLERSEYVDETICVTDWRGILGSPSGVAPSGQSPHRYHTFGDSDLSTPADIIATHLGIPRPARAEHGRFGPRNRPANIGTSKQIKRLHLAGVPHASAVAMMDADCTLTERRVIHMREQGDSLTLIAERLGVTIGKVRRLEKRAVDKILASRKAARKEPS